MAGPRTCRPAAGWPTAACTPRRAPRRSGAWPRSAQAGGRRGGGWAGGRRSHGGWASQCSPLHTTCRRAPHAALLLAQALVDCPLLAAVEVLRVDEQQGSGGRVQRRLAARGVGAVEGHEGTAWLIRHACTLFPVPNVMAEGRGRPPAARTPVGFGLCCGRAPGNQNSGWGGAAMISVMHGTVNRAGRAASLTGDTCAHAKQSQLRPSVLALARPTPLQAGGASSTCSAANSRQSPAARRLWPGPPTHSIPEALSKLSPSDGAQQVRCRRASLPPAPPRSLQRPGAHPLSLCALQKPQLQPRAAP